MGDDFFYALITGWVILAVFWGTIIIFVSIRKPPNSKLSIYTLLYSVFVFLVILIVIFLFR